MLSPLLLFQSGLALGLGFALFLPLFFGILFPNGGDTFLRDVFHVLPTDSMCRNAAVAAVTLANYAYLSGLLLSLAAGKTGPTKSWDVDREISIYTDRDAISAAFDQGCRRSFEWPPPSAFPFSSPDGLVSAVYPKTTVLVGLPVLIVCFSVVVGAPARALGCVAYARACRYLGGDDALVTKSSQQLRKTLVEAGWTLREMMQPVADCMVDTLTPFFFGVTMVLTTSVGIVLYGAGHVGVTTVARSGLLGFFGMDAAALQTTIRKAWQVIWRFDWSWGWQAMVRWKRRHRLRQMRRYDHESEHHHHHLLHHHEELDLVPPDSDHDCSSPYHRFRHRANTGAFPEVDEDLLERLEDEDLKRELLRLRLQRRGLLTQTDGASSISSLETSTNYEYCDSETQTESMAHARDRHHTLRMPSGRRRTVSNWELKGETRKAPDRWPAISEDATW